MRQFFHSLSLSHSALARLGKGVRDPLPGLQMSNEYLAEFCDRLLGVERNDPLHMQITKKLKFSDEEVCKDYLLGLCPYLLLCNTKSDLGPCPKRVHDESLRESFELEGERWRESFELSLFSSLHRIIGDLQKKIRKAQARLETKASEEVEQLLNPEKDEMQERKATLEVQMKILISQLEEYAEKGCMKEVQELNARLDALRAESQRVQAAEESNPLARQEKKMEVCRVCASFLVMNDTQKRLEAHFEGKQHVGYQKVWEYYERYKKKYPAYWRQLEDSSAEAYRRRSGADRRPHSTYGKRPFEENSSSRNYRERDSRSQPHQNYSESRQKRNFPSSSHSSGHTQYH